MKYPTSAPTWLCTIAPTAAPITAVRANTRRMRPTASSACPLSGNDSFRADSQGSATAAAATITTTANTSPASAAAPSFAAEDIAHDVARRGRSS